MSISVIIADDTRFSRKKMINILVSMMPDIQISEASDGIEALNLLREKSFDLMILDIHMPNVDGFGVLESMKQDNIKIKVLVSSADFQQETIDKVKSLGATAFIQKSSSEDEIKSILERIGIFDK